MLRGGKDNCSYKSKDAIACIMLRKCEYVKLIESTEQPTKKDYLQRYKDMTNSREFEEAYLNKPSCEQPSNTRELSEEDKIEVFSRDECIFKYCPHPELCKDECQSKASTLNDKINKDNKVIDKMTDVGKFMGKSYGNPTSHKPNK